MTDAPIHPKRVEALSRLLLDARSSGAGGRIHTVDESLVPASVAEANAVDDAVADALNQPIAGWKVGATSARAQEMLGVSAPFAGRVHAVQNSGAALIDATPAGSIEPHIEGEFAFEMGRPLLPNEAGHSLDAVLAAVAAIRPAIEVVGGRLANMLEVPVNVVVADCGGNRELVLGDPVEPPSDLATSLVEVSAVMEVDGELRGRGRGEDVLGNPINALHWLANHLSDRGFALDAGMVVTTGTATQLCSLGVGSSARLSLAHLGEVALHR